MSFLHHYLAYATANEAPEMFHVWAGYTVMSAAVSRRVWLAHGDEAIFPNIYVMFVGDAGNGKSVALRKAKRILAELDDVHMSRSVETPEGLCRFMAGDPHRDPPLESPVRFIAKWPDGQLRECHPMTIIANEFINFISKNQEGWTSLLNDIYDEDKYEYRTKNMGEDNLIGPYIVLLGALTTEVSFDLQKARIISTGFARRTLFQYGERQWNNPHPTPAFEAAQVDARKACVEHCKKLQKLSGQFTQTPEAVEWWNAWYVPHLKSIPTKAPQFKSWFASKSTQVQKVAMLTSLAQNFDLVITKAHYEVALAYINRMEGELYKIFGGVGRNELASVSMKILDYVTNLTEPISRKRLKATFFSSCRPPNDFDQCLAYLIDGESLVEKTLMVRGVADSVIATPAVMSQFVKSVSGLSARAASTPPVSSTDSPGVTHPPVPPPAPATAPAFAELPDVTKDSAEKSSGPFPTLPTDQVETTLES